MVSLKQKAKEDSIIFAIGSLTYTAIEILWRGYTHWTMTFTGGACFVTLYNIYFKMGHNTPLWKKCAIGSAVITTIEFLVGCIVNLWLKWDVWDYSKLPLNLLGQVCILYTGLWYFLSVPIVFLSKKIKRYFLAT